MKKYIEKPIGINQVKEIDFDKSLLEMINSNYKKKIPDNIDEINYQNLIEELQNEIKLRVMDLNKKIDFIKESVFDED